MIKPVVLKKTTKRLVIYSVIIVLLLAGAIVWLSKTESGLRWVLKRVPNTLEVAHVHGHLSDFSFSGLTLTLDDTSVRIESGKIKWMLLDLASRKLTIESLLLNDLDIQLTTQDTPEQQSHLAWKGLDLPIDIGIKSASIQRLTLSSNGDSLAKFEHIITRLTVTDSLLKLSELDILVNDSHVNLKGDVDLSANANGLVNLINVVNWSDDQKQLSVEGTLQGTWASLKLIQHSTTPIAGNVELNISNLLTEKISWNGSLELSENTLTTATLHSVNLDQGYFMLSGNFSPNDGLAGLFTQLEGQLTGGNNEFSNWELATDIEFENDNLNVRRFDLVEKPRPSTQLLSKQKLEHLPPSKQGELSINGSVIGVSSFLSGKNSHNTKVDLNGVWRDIRWPLSSGIKQVKSSGSFQAVGVPQNFSVSGAVSGESYQRPIEALVDIHVIKRSLDIKTLNLRSGGSSVDIKGRLADEVALEWNISSPNLNDLWPGLNGDLTSTGKLIGTTKTPRLIASALSKRIEYKDLQLNNVNVQANGSLSVSPDVIDLTASVEQARQGSVELGRNISLLIKGTGQQHTLSAGAHLFGQSSFKLQTQGGLTDAGWQGKMTDLRLDSHDYGNWTLDQIVNLAFERSGITSNQACLSNQKQRICAEVASDHIGVKAHGEIHDLKMSNLNPFLSLYDTSIEGKLEGTLSYDKTAAATSAKMVADLQIKDSVISVKKTNTEAQTLIVKSINMQVIQDQTFRSKLLLVLENEDQVSADFTVAAPIESAEFSTADLTGNITADLGDLSRIQALSASLSDLKGSLNAHIDLGGSIALPSIRAEAELNDGHLEIPELGLNLNQTQLAAKSLGKQKIGLSGRIQSGNGTIEIEGHLDFSRIEKPRASLSLKGDNIELINTHDIHVSGNVDTRILITHDLLDLSGNIRLVEAELDFQLPENAVLASQDVILIGEEQGQTSSRQKINLKIDLGDNAHIRAQGLDATLAGTLQLEQEPDGILRANGQIDIQDGRYAAYNQRLTIDKGQLIYNGGSIDDPSLEIRAQKTIGPTTAGVAVTGRASSPVLRLYSSPSLSDQDILSVLIFDKPLGNLASQDGLTLLRIANSLRNNNSGKSQADGLTQNIQESLGLSHLEFELNDNSPSLVAGKQVLSKFYVGYGYGLLDAAQSLILRYKINPFWSIQGDVSGDSGADLRYQIER